MADPTGTTAPGTSQLPERPFTGDSPPELMASLDAIFRPKSVAVIGASTRPSSIGRVIVQNLVN